MLVLSICIICFIESVLMYCIRRNPPSRRLARKDSAEQLLLSHVQDLIIKYCVRRNPPSNGPSLKDSAEQLCLNHVQDLIFEVLRASESPIARACTQRFRRATLTNLCARLKVIFMQYFVLHLLSIFIIFVNAKVSLSFSPHI